MFINLFNKTVTAMGYKLVAFDMDGVLVKEGSWRIIHEYFGTLELSQKNLLAYTRGDISYREFMERDIGAWLRKNGRVHASEIIGVLKHFTITENAEYVIDRLKRKGYNVALVSGGIDIVAREVARMLGIPYVLANTLRFDEDGYLVGGIARVDPLKKHKAMENLLFELGIDKNETVAVGDSIYDLTFLLDCGLGIAYNPDEELMNAIRKGYYGIKVVDDLLGILDYV